MTLHLRTRWHERQAKQQMNHSDYMRCLWWRSLATVPQARIIHATADGRQQLTHVVKVLRSVLRRVA